MCYLKFCVYHSIHTYIKIKKWDSLIKSEIHQVSHMTVLSNMRRSMIRYHFIILNRMWISNNGTHELMVYNEQDVKGFSRNWNYQFNEHVFSPIRGEQSLCGPTIIILLSYFHMYQKRKNNFEICVSLYIFFSLQISWGKTSWNNQITIFF